jgi:hypothetical protein
MSRARHYALRRMMIGEHRRRDIVNGLIAIDVTSISDRRTLTASSERKIGNVTATASSV